MTAHICDAGHVDCFYQHENIARSLAQLDAAAALLRVELPDVRVSVAGTSMSGHYLEVEHDASGVAVTAGTGFDEPGFTASVLAYASLDDVDDVLESGRPVRYTTITPPAGPDDDAAPVLVAFYVAIVLRDAIALSATQNS